MKTYIYFHVCCINRWEEIVENIMNQICDSGLYNKISEIRCVVIGDIDEFWDLMEKYEKVKVLFHTMEPSHMENNWNPKRKIIHNEQIIFNRIYEDAQKEDFLVLYLHSKGVKRNPLNYVWNTQSKKEYDRQTAAIDSWVDYMLHFALYRGAENFLMENDTVGVNLYWFDKEEEQHPPGYSYNGNFWWSKSSYIRMLNTDIHNSYCGPEWWITSGDGKFASMYYSPCDLYQVVFPKEDYVNKPIMYLQATSDIAKFKSDQALLCGNLNQSSGNQVESQ